jgi:hypothetical protein
MIKQKFNKRIQENFDYEFEVSKRGLYSISITARCCSGKQIKQRGGEDLRIEIDNQSFREIPSEKNTQLYNIPPAWNGTKLEGLKKTVVFVLWLEKGNHKITFIPNKGAFLEDLEINLIKNTSVIEFSPEEQAEDGDTRPWYVFVLVNLPLRFLTVKATTRWRFLDSDDIKLIIDGKIQKPEGFFSKWRNWLWSGSIFKKLLQKETQTKTIETNLKGKEIHYIEFWADRTPILHRMKMDLGKRYIKKEKTIVQKYIFKGLNGKEDYNRYDAEIKEAVDYWNDVFTKEEYPPEELLDPNLVKAIIYKESRVGYYPGGEIDVMQVGNPDDPALRALNGELKEWEIRNGKQELLNYHGEARVISPKDSIYWGIRWLYHKAQGITNDKKRYWKNWEEAVYNYGPGTEKYLDEVLRIYKKGIDPDGNILWKKKENGFVLFKTLIFIALGLFLVFAGYFYNEFTFLNHKDRKSESLSQVNNSAVEIFFKDLEKYKKEEDYAFQETSLECKKIKCVNQSLFYQYYKLLIENMHSNEHFLVAAVYLTKENIFHKRDIDNDGENEIIFSLYDSLNRDFVSLVVIDRINGKFQAIEKRIDAGHRSRISVVDLTSDLKPEIAFFVAFNKGGYMLFVYQYSKGKQLKEIFKYRKPVYPVYTFSDIDNDMRMEIKIEGEIKNAAPDYGELVEEIYEYNPEKNNFILFK